MKKEILCDFCNTSFDDDDRARCASQAEAAACFWNKPIPELRPVHPEPLTEGQLRAMQQLIDAGAITALDARSGGTSWSSKARLLIAGGKLEPPRTKRGKADFGPQRVAHLI